MKTTLTTLTKRQTLTPKSERFTTLCGQPRKYIGRLNSDGTLDTNFTAEADSYVRALALQSDGKILVGGAFSVLAGINRSCIGRLNSTNALASQSLISTIRN